MDVTTADDLLTVRDLNFYYGKSHTLKDINFVVPRGSCVAVIGRNGVGKTTLLKTIMGLLLEKSGSIYFANTKLNGRLPYYRARLGIGYVPQGREIFPQLTVEENLRITLTLEKNNQAEIPEQIFQIFPNLKNMLQRRGGDLSGGLQQQLAIARALAFKPALLILDEPTEGLQPNLVQEICKTIIDLKNQEKLTILLVEQKLNFARKAADYFCLMERGFIVASGPIAALDNNLARKYLAL